jgi:hypothetical protein
MVGRHPAPGASSAHARLRGRAGLTTAASLRAQRTRVGRYAVGMLAPTLEVGCCERQRDRWSPLVLGEPFGANDCRVGGSLQCHWRPWLRLFNPPLVDSANSLQSRRAHHAGCGAERQCDWSETESVVALVACERPETLFVGATRTVKSGQ